MLIDVTEARRSPAVLKVIGLGGGGGNAVNRMLASEIRGVEFLVANTDVQALEASFCANRIQIGAGVTNGLGSGGNPQSGRASAEEDLELLREHLRGADMIFIACGMGGGTGTGASPVVARAARELGALTVGIVTKPFAFEGRQRMRQAEAGVEELRAAVDTLIVIPNQRLLHVVDKATPLNEALRVADDVLTHATKGISEIITVPGLINVDFADVRSVMAGMGNALMGMGFGRGPDRARQAADMAICSPLLEDISIGGAQGLLVNFMGGEDMTLAEVDEASTLILDAAGSDANVIFGAVIDPAMQDEIRVTLIATGFGDVARAAQKAAEPRHETLRLSTSDAPAPIPMHAAAALSERMVVGAGNEPSAESAASPIVIGRTARLGLTSRPAAGDLCDGVIGPPRPIRREAEPAASVSAPAPEAAPAATAVEEESQASIVPLVWKQNQSANRWAPKAASRWQRVLQREQADVPSFMRRRQRD
jgi:cell division protein FtsZ